jgi:hypothetical protein
MVASCRSTYPRLSIPNSCETVNNTDEVDVTIRDAKTTLAQSAAIIPWPIFYRCLETPLCKARGLVAPLLCSLRKMNPHYAKQCATVCVALP